MKSLSNIIENVQDHLFQSVVSNNLVYNTCWEDPRVDRRLLQLDKDSKVVLLTSAGCNALDYLLDNPRRIHCVDINPSQNKLLELKLALISNGNYSLLWDFFGEGWKAGAEVAYNRSLRPLLPGPTQEYWDRNIGYFTSTQAEPSFYFRGTSGRFALMIRNRIKRKQLLGKIPKLLNAQSLKEQTYYFNEIEPLLWSGFQKWMIGRYVTMAMLGVPATQRKMIEKRYKNGMLGFIRQSLRHVFTDLPLTDNYFWRVYLTGSYTKNCCPNYLRKHNFNLLRQRNGRIRTHASTLLRFLKRHPGSYSHFVLLDHQDWMAFTKPELLAEEWRHILANSETGTRILFRSAGPSTDFLPSFIGDNLNFRPELTKRLHRKDRVGTYEKTHLAVVN